MANPNPSAPPQPLYPEIPKSNPESTSSPSSSSSLYPSIDTSDLGDLFPDSPKTPTTTTSSPSEETLLSIPGAVLHLIDKSRSVELSSGTLSLLRIRHVAVLARVGPHHPVQWPLTLDSAAVKLDPSHYFFSLRLPEDGPTDEPLNYGLTFPSSSSSSDPHLLDQFDSLLRTYCSFSEQKVSASVAEVLDDRPAAVYWTALAPNVEDYSSLMAKGIAVGSVHLVKGILWCGDVAVDRIRWGDELLRKRMGPNDKPAEISKETLERIKRVKKVTKMSEKVATGILSGVVRVSGFFTSSVVNSKAGKKFFDMLPGEVVLASLEGFGKICDAVEVAGKNVLSTSSVVTTGLVSHRYGEEAAEAANEGLDAAGHALGTAWTVFKIRKAIDPKSSLKPTTLAKSAAKAAAAELKVKMGK